MYRTGTLPFMKKLADWLKKKEIALTEFAPRVGVTHAQLSRVLSGKRRPSLQLMQRIKDETGGYINLDDFSRQPPVWRPPGGQAAE